MIAINRLADLVGGEHGRVKTRGAIDASKLRSRGNKVELKTNKYHDI